MFVAALIVLLIALLLLLSAVFGGGADASLNMGLFQIDANAAVVFFLGMVTLLLFVVSLEMFRRATRRAGKRRAERRQMGELSEKLDAYRREDREPGETDGKA